ncbi:MAG: 50S ribosomal protein L18 [Planctomycetaceae bacterium]
MKLKKRIAGQRERRAFRVRNRVRPGSRPRLSVYRSNRQIYAQIIDDVAGRTLVSASTIEKGLGGSKQDNGNKDAAARVGKVLAERAVEAGIRQVAFDRGSYKYHGRIAALADSAREAGLEF